MTQQTETKAATPIESAAATDVEQFFSELDGGIFARKLSIALSQCAAATVDHGKNSKVSIELTISRIDGSMQVFCDHKLKFVKPTLDGESSEQEKRKTILHVGKFGKLTLVPESQLDMFQAKK